MSGPMVNHPRTLPVSFSIPDSGSGEGVVRLLAKEDCGEEEHVTSLSGADGLLGPIHGPCSSLSRLNSRGGSSSSETRGRFSTMMELAVFVQRDHGPRSPSRTR